MMKKLMMLVVLVVLAVFTVGQAFAKPIEIHWWHAMRSARGEVCNAMIKDFNASQDKYVVIGTNKGNYDETVNAGVAAIRAKKQPHILQSFEVGTQTMMLSGAIYPIHQLMKDKGYQVDWKGYLQPVLSYYMNADGNHDPTDIIELKKMVRGQDTAGMMSRPNTFVVLEQPGGTVKRGDTCHVTLGVPNDGGTYSPSFGIDFTIGASSTGSATILGGEGVSGSGRYDVSGDDGTVRAVLKFLS